MRSLVRLKSLQAFEAASRHGSFVSAAGELGVSAAAVGQLVRSLEGWLGAPLFQRRKAGSERLVVTGDAQAAVAKLTEGLDRLEAGLDMLRARRGRQAVTVTASQAMVAKWLLPHLHAFSARHPAIDVRLDVSDRLLDLAHGEADLGVRCGPGTWPGLVAVRLMGEEVFPVCSPALVGSRGPQCQAWLAEQTFIHDASLAASGVFPTWRD